MTHCVGQSLSIGVSSRREPWRRPLAPLVAWKSRMPSLPDLSTLGMDMATATSRAVAPATPDAARTAAAVTTAERRQLAVLDPLGEASKPSPLFLLKIQNCKIGGGGGKRGQVPFLVFRHLP